MRFRNYLMKDSKIHTFRSLQIKLVETKTEYDQIVEFVENRYDVNTEVKKLLETFNQKLKVIYKGKYKFDLCLNEGITPDNIKKIDNKKIKSIKKEWYRVNDNFAKIQKDFEKYLQERG